MDLAVPKKKTPLPFSDNNILVRLLQIMIGEIELNTRLELEPFVWTKNQFILENRKARLFKVRILAGRPSVKKEVRVEAHNIHTLHFPVNDPFGLKAVVHSQDHIGGIVQRIDRVEMRQVVRADGRIRPLKSNAGFHNMPQLIDLNAGFFKRNRLNTRFCT